MYKNYMYSVLLPLAPWEPVSQVKLSLESLANQSLPPAQVVVSCDGRPGDELLDLLSTSSLPLEILIGPGKEGVGIVLARGLISCKNELVIRCDADDISHKDRCLKQVNMMLNNDFLAAAGSFISEFIDTPKNCINIRVVPTEGYLIARTSRFRNPMNHPSIILRRSAILAIGNYRDIRGFEDFDLWLRLLKLNGPGCLSNLPETLVSAKVGLKHSKRRHGIKYFSFEFQFFYRCFVENLIPAHCILFTLITRLPLRIMPISFLELAMKRTRI